MVDRIVCAAIRNAQGLIICGARHFDEVMYQQIMSLPKEDFKRAEQGFINQRGEFLSREAAWCVAKAAGQIINDPDWFPGTLHSEHLY